MGREDKGGAQGLVHFPHKLNDLFTGHRIKVGCGLVS